MAGLLSVVVIGRNEGGRLSRCLASTRPLRDVYPDFELLYVDSASTDGSLKVVRRAGARVISVDAARPTPAIARNLGWRACSTPFVMFLDGDSLLEPGFVGQAMARFEDPSVAIVWGRLSEIAARSSLYKRIFHLHWPKPAPGPVDICSGTALVRRSALESVQGFDSALVAEEEAELCHRLRKRGFVLIHVDYPMAQHDLAMDRWSHCWWRAVRGGYGRAQVASRCQTARAQRGWQRAWSNRLWGTWMVAGPLGAVLGSVAFRSWLPFLGFLLLTLSTVQWISLRRSECDPVSRLLYAIHLHVVQVPMLWGQLLCLIDRWARRPVRLFELRD